jgi:tetratricopeptide (TPR) repeat protein
MLSLKKILIVAVIVCNNISSYEQSHWREINRDSLLKILPSLVDSERIDCLNLLARCYLMLSDSSKYFASIANKESIKLNYTRGIAESLSNMGAFEHLNKGNCGEAEKKFTEALQWFNKTTRKSYIDIAYFEFGLTLSDEGKFEESYNAFHNAIFWFSQNHDLIGIDRTLGFIGETYLENGEYDSAFKYLKEDLDFQKKNNLNIKMNVRNCLVWLGDCYEAVGDYETSLTYFRQSLNLFEVKSGSYLQMGNVFKLMQQYDSALIYYRKAATTDHPDSIGSQIGIGEIYLFEQEYDKALKNFKKPFEHLKKNDNSHHAMKLLLDIGQAYEGKDDFKTAFHFGNELLKKARQTGARTFIRDGYGLVSKVYESLGNEDSAYVYLQRFMTLKDSIINKQILWRLNNFKKEAEEERARARIAILSRDNKIQQQQLQQEKTNRYVLISSMIVSLLLAVFALRNIQLKRRKDQLQHLMTDANAKLENKRKEQLLSEVQQQKTELEMQALRAQMNPHFIFNSLNSINMFILENNKLRASEYLSKFSRLIRLILQNSKEAFISLESELEALQLYLELESLRFDNKFEYKISVDEDIDTTTLKVPPLIIQPYAENAIWHGLMHKKEKGHLEIELYAEDEILFCIITDDGIGRKKAAELKSKSSTHKSMGIKITENRIAMMQLNGDNKSVEIKDLVYADGSAAGTEVVLRIPIVSQE